MKRLKIGFALLVVASLLLISGAAPAVGDARPPQTHVVQAGDTLWSIAQTYGTTVEALLDYNNLRSSVIRVGQFIDIPQDETPKNVSVYFVKYSSGDTSSLNSLKQNWQTIDTIIPFSFWLDSSGKLYGSVSDELIQFAREKDIDIIPLVHNISGGNFSKTTIHNLLVSSSARSRAVSEISTMVKSNGFAGINIDFENVPSGDRPYYTQFVQELSAKLRPEGYLVTLSIPAKTRDVTTGWAGAFDYEKLGTLVDEIMIMTYDYHWRGSSPGPVAPYPWVQEVLDYATAAIPARKISMGIPGYGYDWPLAGGTATSISAVRAMAKAAEQHTVVQWDNDSKSLHYRYTKDGSEYEVWFEDRNSLAYKLDLVREHGISGFALWRLGYEDPSIWELVGDKLK